jgi:hypothetical protein
MKYTKLQLATSLVVEIRQRTYGEWSAMESKRAALLKRASDILAGSEPNKDITVKLLLLEGEKEFRETRLTQWVRDFSEELTLSEIAEIEKFAIKAEQGEIESGNV